MRGYMEAAIEQAELAGGREEVPIGAVLVNPENGEIIARAGNRTRELNDPTAHAEILCIRDACTQKNAQRIPGFHLYVTLEPCTMCSAAISFARISHVIYGAQDEKGGAIDSGVCFYETRTCHHKPQVTGGLMADQCGRILKDFFQKRR